MILGAIEVGDGAKVGSGSVVVKPVPPGATVVGVPGRVVKGASEVIPQLEHGKLPDPLAEIIGRLTREQDELKERISSLEKLSRSSPSEVLPGVGHNAGG